jgi:hypothetical protein
MQLKSSTKRFASALAATLALVACGDDDTAPMNTADGGLADQGIMTADSAVETDGSTSPDMGTANEISFDDLPAAVADAWCNRIECFGELGDDFFSTLILGGGSDDPVVCRARLTRVLSGMLSVEEEGYDPRAAFDCVETLRNPATACEDVLEPKCPALDAGESEFHGNVAMGGECVSSYECDAGLRCDRTDLPDYRCAGTCQPGSDPGDACTSYDDCSNLDDASVTCDLSSGNGHTALNICVRTAYENNRAEGESCTEVTFDEATNTLTTSYCASGLDCRDDECTKTEAGLGEDCTELECGEGLTCSEEGDTAGTCQPLFSFAFEAGDDCGLISEENIVFCDFLSGATGYVCDITDEEDYTGTCVAIGDGSLGSVCLAFEELGFTCDEGLFCATEYREGIFAGRCSQPLAAGETCNDDNNCLSGVCEYDSQLSRSICMEANLEDGAGCSNNRQCASNNCAFDGEGTVCAPLECSIDG